MGNLKDTIEHARFGNTNAQETIRFIDTKIGVALAFLGAICGGAYNIWSTSIKSLAFNGITMDWMSVFITLSVLCFIGFIVCLVRAVHFCCKGLSPRPPNTEGNKVKHSILFPYIPNNDFSKEYRAGVNKLTTGMSDEEILSEFEDQSVVLGQIIAAKLMATKVAIANLKWLVYFLLAMSCLLCATKCASKTCIKIKDKHHLQYNVDGVKSNSQETAIIREP